MVDSLSALVTQSRYQVGLATLKHAAEADRMLAKMVEDASEVVTASSAGGQTGTAQFVPKVDSGRTIDIYV
jgi:phosphoribosyl-ATP pyrophosphohydrolase